MSAFAYRLLPLIIVLAGCSRAEEKQKAYTNHSNLNEPFSLHVPAGWSVEDTSYYIMWRIEVFALARNLLAADITPDFSKNWQSGNGVNLNAGLSSNVKFAEDLPPGGAIVMFWRFEGPPVDCNFLVDTVGESLASVVDTLQMDFSRPIHFRFFKWGKVWEVEVLGRSVAPADRVAIRDLLRSILFEPVPVVSQGQAAQLAYHAIPSVVRGSGEPCQSLHVDVAQAGAIFEARFRSCISCGCGAQAVEAIEGKWRYRVHANGVVEAVAG